MKGNKVKEVKGIYLDFGFVIGFPDKEIEKKYLYLNWDGIPEILKDMELKKRIRPKITEKTLTQYFRNEIYLPFINNEKSNKIDPGSYVLLKKSLHKIFRGNIDQSLTNRVLQHINTMPFIYIDDTIIPIVRGLKSKYTLSLISNMMLPGSLLIEKLEAHNLASLFDTISISSDIGYMKPHGKIFTETLKRDHLKAEEVIFVGDTYSQDILGAASLGFKTIWLNCRKEDLQEQQLMYSTTIVPNAAINNIEELNEVISKLIKKSNI